MAFPGSSGRCSVVAVLGVLLGMAALGLQALAGPVMTFSALDQPEGHLQRMHQRQDSQEPSLGITWSNCGTSNPVVKLNSATVTPDPLTYGKVKYSLNVTASRELSSPIEAKLDVEYYFIWSWRHVPCKDNVGSCDYPDICKPANGPCPMKQGTHLIEGSVNLSDMVLQGRYNITVNLYQHSSWLACYNFVDSVQ